MLEAANLEVAYDGQQVLWGPTIRVNDGEIVCLLGPNGAGKSTLVNAVSGLVSLKGGTIKFQDQRIDHFPTHRRIDAGLAHVLERRRVFPYMSVQENLHLGAFVQRARDAIEETEEWVLSLFPVLGNRLRQAAYTLSGGEQQMLAIGRGLMSRPKMLIIDEPYLGLAPKVMHEISEIVTKINRVEGVTVLFIEQNIQEALELADRGYVLEAGEIVLEGPSSDLLKDQRIQRVYLGVD